MNTFDFQGQNLRTILLNGAVWFVAKDICLCLGLQITGGTHQHLKKLDADEKRVAVKPNNLLARKLNPNNQILGVREMYGKTESSMAVVSESGLYKLIMRADSANAKPFQDWVTKEVLPSIRKTGGYLLNEHARETAHADTREAMPYPKDFCGLAINPCPWRKDSPRPPVRSL